MMALIRGKEVKEGPTQIPANPKLHNMVVVQAKARFSKYPSPAAAHWVHTHYVQMGGKFVESKKEIDPRNRDRVQEAIDKKKEESKKKVTHPVGKNLTAGETFKY
jgi:hypothetical protein